MCIKKRHSVAGMGGVFIFPHLFITLTLTHIHTLYIHVHTHSSNIWYSLIL